MAIFFATYRTFSQFFPLLFILEKKLFYLECRNISEFSLFFCSLQTVKKNPLSLIQFWRKGCVTYRTLFCNAFFPKHIYLFTAKKLTFIHQIYGVYPSFWSICFQKICVCNLSDTYFLS